MGRSVLVKEQFLRTDSVANDPSLFNSLHIYGIGDLLSPSSVSWRGQFAVKFASTVFWQNQDTVGCVFLSVDV